MGTKNCKNSNSDSKSFIDSSNEFQKPETDSQIRQRPLTEFDTQTCSFCNRYGHSMVTCLVRREEIKIYFREYFYDYQHLCGFIDCDPSHFSKPFLIRYHRPALIVRLFRDLYFCILFSLRDSLDKKNTKYIIEQTLSIINEYRNKSEIQISQHWWSDENWQSFLLVADLVLQKLDGRKVKFPNNYIFRICNDSERTRKEDETQYHPEYVQN